jgi:hypothetical protein
VLGTFYPFFSPADENSIFLQAGRLFCITILCGPLSKEVAITASEVQHETIKAFSPRFSRALVHAWVPLAGHFA